MKQPNKINYNFYWNITLSIRYQKNHLYLYRRPYSQTCELQMRPYMGYNESINEPPYHENKGHSPERFICCVMIFNCTPEETKTTDDTILYMIYTCIRSLDQIQFCLRQSDDYVKCQYIKINPLLSRGYQEYTWFVSFTVGLFVCSTGFFSRYPCCTRLQKGCLWSPHTIPMESLTDSCQWSRGIVRPDSGCGFFCCQGLMLGFDSGCLL